MLPTLCAPLLYLAGIGGFCAHLGSQLPVSARCPRRPQSLAPGIAQPRIFERQAISASRGDIGQSFSLGSPDNRMMCWPRIAGQFCLQLLGYAEGCGTDSGAEGCTELPAHAVEALYPDGEV